LGGINAQKERDAVNAKAAHTLENRLHTAMIKNSDAKSKTSQIRRDIESFRREKTQNCLLLVMCWGWIFCELI
jgi:hypothetical protein